MQDTLDKEKENVAKMQQFLESEREQVKQKKSAEQQRRDEEETYVEEITD